MTITQGEITMYVIVVSLESKPEHHQDFIKAALQDAHDSSLNEPGTQRFERLQDGSHPNRFYLSEAFEERAAFEAHESGPYAQAYFAAVSGYYAQKPMWLVRGTLIVSSGVA
jgi:(4S)-4-hydroxy-5-phosphonooxypentane-2,3-dione isomerase